MKNITTNLKLLNGKSIIYNDDCLNNIKSDITDFLYDKEYMNNILFAKKMMMSQEIKSNNLIEGINDDLTLIDEVIKNKKTISINERNRIVNLYHGYQYILTHKKINKESLKELYSIVSCGLLDSYALDNMGEYYREKPVYIYEKNRYDAYPSTGVDEGLVDYYMDSLFEYINSSTNLSDDEISYFIKSQIIHFYFVYIHPYFDVNGRTSRCVSMWYLLKNKVYPYIGLQFFIISIHNLFAYILEFLIVFECIIIGNFNSFANFILLTNLISCSFTLPDVSIPVSPIATILLLFNLLYKFSKSVILPSYKGCIPNVE